MITSAEVRSHLIDALQLDLVGPTPDNAIHAEEILDQAPSKWYLTGFLVPYGAPVEQRVDDAGDEDLDVIDCAKSGDDENVPEKSFARKAFFPSSMGLSILVPQKTTQLNVTVQWGDYQPITIEDGEGEQNSLSGCWQRIPRQAELIVPLRADSIPTQLNLELEGSTTTQLQLPLGASCSPRYLDVPSSNGLQLIVSVRPVLSQELVPPGTLSVSVFLVNHRRPSPDKKRDVGYVFQTNLIIHTPYSLVPRPNLRGQDGDDWDEKVADVQYRDDYEYAVGHNVSAIAIAHPDDGCQEVRTAWIPF
ncbi:MAG: hypothetical protein PUP91_27395 [Rhizonema sp. PD37]|nr:hypothetical protein [Rhizonema sp. PD37]